MGPELAPIIRQVWQLWGRQFSRLVGVGMNIHGLLLALIGRLINVRLSHASQRLLPTVTSY